MDLNTKVILLSNIRKNAIKAEDDFRKKLEELDKQKHLEFERFEKKIEDLVKDIPEEDFASFVTACLGTMSDSLNAMMIASYVKGHENMNPARKKEFLIMAALSAGALDTNEVEKALFPDGFDG